ncbi:hypothetical protein GGR57DRAFT_242976 [Xylariaceae sp. FL1272]|nr:hypothetical protein GGR57DRAFT_242976 [Xylariaceae sp. FL1272]
MWSGNRATSRVESSASPTTTTSTGNKGGRPRDWTETRKRKLIRLYLFTNLPFPKVLNLLEEDGFTPGKDAANKVKNGALGNDPRWMRPKDEEEEKSRVRALRNSLRGRHGRKSTPQTNAVKVEPDAWSTPHYHEDGSLGGTTVAHSFRSSIEELSHADASLFGNQPSRNWFGSIAHVNPANHHDDAMNFTFNRLSRRDTSRQGTGLTASTDISVNSVIKEKLANFTEAYQKRVAKVLKRYTFPKNAESSPVRPNLDQPLDDDYSDDQMGAGYAIPGDFLRHSLQPRQQYCARHNVHHSDSLCWCRIADEVLPTQELWNAPTVPYDLSVRDTFGNTVFHYRAALDSYNHDSFLHSVYQALPDITSTVYAKNTAGQTFLHVLHSSWFQPGSRLNDLINILQGTPLDVLATDVYGRSFYHLLRRHQPGSARFPSNQILDHRRMNRRDAFGMRPMDTRTSRNTKSTAGFVPKVERTETTSTLGSMRGTKRMPAIDTQCQSPQEKEWTTNADLLRVVNSSINVDAESLKNSPQETPLGQNGFHCLAEVRMNLSSTETSATVSPDTPTSRSKEQTKRKHRESEEVDTPQTRKRDGYIRSLMESGVDVNQYDANGNTPLMAFVVNSSDATKWEKEDGENVIKILVRQAEANMELRNRHGETALHIAAKAGKPIALRTLLDLGANPHTRNSQGLGVLEVVDRLYLTSERDDRSNARFEACRAVLTRNDQCAKQRPTILDEWSFRPPSRSGSRS